MIYISQDKLNSIINQPLKYNQLCKALDLPIKTSDSKAHQLDQLQLYCDLDIEDHPTRYIVKEVYGGKLAFLEGLNKNNKFQALFDSAMYNALLKNNCQPLYFSNMELLNLFNEVNENFSYTCNKGYMDLLGEDYKNINEMSQIVYKILKQWTRRRLKQMEARKIILTRQGFRLYAHNGDYYIYYNVETDSEEEKICQEIYYRASKDALPEGWAGEWIPAWKWEKFENKIKEIITEYFNGDYDNLRNVLIVSPPREAFLKTKLNEIYQANPELKAVNEEAQRKIMTTSQLNQYNNNDRQNLIDISIVENPKIIILDKIKKKGED